MTPEQIAELEKAATVAFPRPWRIDVDEEGDARHVVQPVYEDGEEQEVVVAAECWDEEFARFIVAATNALPSLLSDARDLAALRAAVEALRTAAGKHARWQFDRMFGAVEGRDVYDSAGFVRALEALLPGGDAKETADA